MSAPTEAAPEDLEAWYDNEIAPPLAAIGKACIERKVPFAAAVGYGDTIGQTFWAPPGLLGWQALREIAAHCITADGAFKIDDFLLGLMKHTRHAGHSSLILKQLGVPETPGGAS